MIKTKIFKANRVMFSLKPQFFKFISKGNGVLISGRIEINFVSEEIRLYVKSIKRLENIFNNKKNESKQLRSLNLTQEERISIIKEIFYRFCIKQHNSLNFKGYYIEDFSFIEYPNQIITTSLIANTLLLYNSVIFSNDVKNERIIRLMKDTMNMLGRREIKKRQVVKFKILPITFMISKEEVLLCYEMLNRLLKKQRYKGRLKLIEVAGEPIAFKYCCKSFS